MRVSPTTLYIYLAAVVLDELCSEEDSFDILFNPPVLGMKSEESGTTTSCPLESCVTSKGTS